MGPSRHARAFTQDFCSRFEEENDPAPASHNADIMTGRLARFRQPAQRDCGKGRAGRLNVLLRQRGPIANRFSDIISVSFSNGQEEDKRSGLLDKKDIVHKNANTWVNA